jgi:hypothetical protein
MSNLNRNTILILVIASVISLSSISFALIQNDTPSQTHSEGTQILGHVALTLYGPDNIVKAYRQSDNLVVTNGDNSTANRIFGTTLTTNSVQGGTFSWVSVGTSGTAVSSFQLNMLQQAGNHRLGTVTNGIIHGQAFIAATFPANKITNNSVGINLQEVGLFDSFSNSTTNLFARQTYSAINVFPADSLQVTWTVTIT